jgi:positive regulator of sigma E activity
MTAESKCFEGTIITVSSRTVMVRLSAFCQSQCKSCGGCSSSKRTSEWEFALNKAHHPLLDHADPGQRVTLEGEIPGSITAALVLFGLPLILTATAACITWLVTGNETKSIIGGFSGFIGSALPISWIHRRLCTANRCFTVVKLHSEEKDPTACS